MRRCFLIHSHFHMKDVHQSVPNDILPAVAAILSRNGCNSDDVESITMEIRQVVESALLNIEALRNSADFPRKLTPPKLAKLWGVSPDKILSWIRSGELRAVNIATDRSCRPRYVIDRKDIEQFEATRVSTRVERPTRRRSKKVDGIVEYF